MFKKTIFIITLLFIFCSLFPSCKTIDKASREAAEFDNKLNQGNEKLIHHMDHYQG